MHSRQIARILLAALLLAALTCDGPAVAAALTVDATGREGFKSIGAAIERAGQGDTILIKPGTYRETVRPKSDVRLVAEKGPLQTGVFVERGGRGVFVGGATNVIAEGFNIYSVLGAGKPTDGLVTIQNSANVTVRDCYIHDAAYDSDCVKVSDVRRERRGLVHGDLDGEMMPAWPAASLLDRAVGRRYREGA